MGYQDRLRRVLCATTALCAFSALPTWAQDQTDTEKKEEDLGTIILTSDRSGTEVLDVPANVTVIDGEAVGDRNITDIEELTRTVPGVTVVRQTSSADPFNSFGGVTIRGVGGNRVQLQVDGSRMAESIIDGTRDYFDLNFTKQVEIVRGPASVQWGADALGGLFRVETIDPEDLLRGRERGGSVRLAYDGLDESTLGALSFAQELSPALQVMIGLSREESSEIELRKARNTDGIWDCPRNFDYGAIGCDEFDPMSKTSDRLLAKAVWTPNANHRLEFTVDLLDRETDVEQKNALGPQYSAFTGNPTGEILHSKDRHQDLSRNRIAIEHSWTPDGGFFDQLKTTLAYTTHQADRSGVERTTSAGGDEIRTRDYLDLSEDFLELDVQANATVAFAGATHELVFGFDGDLGETDYARRDVEHNLTTGQVNETRGGGFNFANADTRRADIYLEDRITFAGGRFELTPGLRYATYRIEPRTNGDYRPVVGKEPRIREDEELIKSLGALYRIDETYSVWAKYGEGFKMPTAQQLFTSSPGFFNLIPAPDLKPEKVKSLELGLRGEYDRGFFAVNAFRAEYEDFIQSFYFVPNTNDITYRNLSEVNIWGLEASGAWAFTDVTRATMTASWQKGVRRASKDAPKRAYLAPPLMASIGVIHELPQYELELEAVGTFARGVTRTPDDAAYKPGGYGVLDLHAKWQVVDNGYLNLSVKNAFDKRYLPYTAASYDVSASAAVQRSNPIEQQTGPGRTISLSFDMAF